jgi:hypothetical protein
VLREHDEEHTAIKKIPVLCEKNVLDDLEPGVDRPVEGRGGGAGVCEGGLPGHHPRCLANRSGQRSTNHSQFLVNIFLLLISIFIFSGSARVHNGHTNFSAAHFLFLQFDYSLNSI